MGDLLDLRRTRPERPDNPKLTHGTHGSYNRGCGCAPCRDGERRYQAGRRHARQTTSALQAQSAA